MSNITNQVLDHVKFGDGGKDMGLCICLDMGSKNSHEILKWKAFLDESVAPHPQLFPMSKDWPHNWANNGKQFSCFDRILKLTDMRQIYTKVCIIDENLHVDLWEAYHSLTPGCHEDVDSLDATKYQNGINGRFFENEVDSTS